LTVVIRSPLKLRDTKKLANLVTFKVYDCSAKFNEFLYGYGGSWTYLFGNAI